MRVEPHPLLHLAAFVTTFPRPLGTTPSPGWLTDMLRLDADAPVSRTPEIKTQVRDLLRHGGFKPSGRNKPASEYLVGAATKATLSSINTAVDVCNVVSLHSGLPISVVDSDRITPPLKIAIAPQGSRYVFNPAGQEIDVGGLLCLMDADGPCGNAVKDSQRTKTSEHTQSTLSVVWGIEAAANATDAATRWYRELLGQLDATTRAVTLEQP